MLVKDIMTEPVVTIREDQSIWKHAKLCVAKDLSACQL